MLLSMVVFPMPGVPSRSCTCACLHGDKHLTPLLEGLLTTDEDSPGVLSRHCLAVQPFNKNGPSKGLLQTGGSLGVSAPVRYQTHVGHQLTKLPVTLEDWELCSHSSDSVWVVSGARQQLGLPLPAPAESCMAILTCTPWLQSHRRTRASPLPCARDVSGTAVVDTQGTRRGVSDAGAVAAHAPKKASWPQQ